jgi:hypothetical protein
MDHNCPSGFNEAVAKLILRNRNQFSSDLKLAQAEPDLQRKFKKYQEISQGLRDGKYKWRPDEARYQLCLALGREYKEIKDHENAIIYLAEAAKELSEAKFELAELILLSETPLMSAYKLNDYIYAYLLLNHFPKSELCDMAMRIFRPICLALLYDDSNLLRTTTATAQELEQADVNILKFPEKMRQIYLLKLILDIQNQITSYEVEDNEIDGSSFTTITSELCGDTILPLSVKLMVDIIDKMKFNVDLDSLLNELIQLVEFKIKEFTPRASMRLFFEATPPTEQFYMKIKKLLDEFVQTHRISQSSTLKS